MQMLCEIPKDSGVFYLGGWVEDLRTVVARKTTATLGEQMGIQIVGVSGDRLQVHLETEGVVDADSMIGGTATCSSHQCRWPSGDIGDRAGGL